MGVIMLPESLRSALGDVAARDLVELFNASQKETRESTLETAEDRFSKSLSETEAKIVTQIAQLETKLVSRIEQTRADMIKWMFVLWSTSILLLIVNQILRGSG